MLKGIFILLFLSTQIFSSAQSPIDVLHYKFELELNDQSDTVKGSATIDVRFLQAADSLLLDFMPLKQVGGKGMSAYTSDSLNMYIAESTSNDKIVLHFFESIAAGEKRQLQIEYKGIPADGLIISKNKYNERTFFADNWPNRARHWIPCNDRPDDKATVEFIVTAPEHYKIISNGVLVSEKDTSSGQKITHWKEEIPIPTKVMVIGAARFAVKQFAGSIITPVSAWVYPQDSAKGFYDYELVPPIVKFFSDYIGPYPFEKLANVQSKTIFGGMENAGAIFYGENTVIGDRKSEALLAHEIAHQWFGNSATEKAFAHLWLSEGFATYMTNLYLEHKYGRDTLVKRLQADRKEIIQFSKESRKPVVDSTSDLMELLNANSYQKGGWVLHMLRSEVGDTVFQNIIRTYYDQYKFSNADTWAFERVAEEVSGKDLKAFFQQWLYTPGHPQAEVQWQWSGGRLSVTVNQRQEQAFPFPLTIGVYEDLKKLEPHRLYITKAVQTFILPATKKPVQVILDPDTGLLFEGKVEEGK